MPVKQLPGMRTLSIVWPTRGAIPTACRLALWELSCEAKICLSCSIEAVPLSTCLVRFAAEGGCPCDARSKKVTASRRRNGATPCVFFWKRLLPSYWCKSCISWPKGFGMRRVLCWGRGRIVSMCESGDVRELK